MADATFECKGKTITAHTLILASGSTVLAAMFQGDFIENQERVVKITDIMPEVFEQLLCYIYTGDADLKNGDAENLMIAADKYAIDSLKEVCSLHLSTNITVRSASRYLVLSHLHNSAKLREYVLTFMSKNAKAICSRNDWMRLIQNYPDELCFQATKVMVGL